MANEHVARLQKIGFGKESAAGTAVAASFWLPKARGLAVPKVEYVYDQSAYGNIDKNREAYIARKWTEVTISDTLPRDTDVGHLLMAKYGSSWPCVQGKRTQSSVFLSSTCSR